MAAKLKERKIANTKASVVLGTDEPLWETDMMRSMSNGEITPEFIQCMIEDKQQADSLAAELKIDHCIGVVTGVEPTTNFTQTSTMADPTGEMHKYQAKIGGRTASKASSVYFGVTRAGLPHDDAGLHECCWDGHGEGSGPRRRARMRSCSSRSSKCLRSRLGMMNRPMFLPCTRAILPSTSRRRNVSCRKKSWTISEKSTTRLGEDKVIYETDMMRSMRNGEITPEFIQCMKEDKAQADALAAELKIDHCRGVVTGVYPLRCA